MPSRVLSQLILFLSLFPSAALANSLLYRDELSSCPDPALRTYAVTTTGWQALVSGKPLGKPGYLKLTDKGSQSSTTNLNSFAVEAVPGAVLWVKYPVRGLLLYSEEYSLPLEHISSVQFEQRVEGSNQRRDIGCAHLALRISDLWYISVDCVSQEVKGRYEPIDFRPKEIMFRQTPAFQGIGPKIPLGPEQALPQTGTVSGFGAFYTKVEGRVRIDNFSINGTAWKNANSDANQKRNCSEIPIPEVDPNLPAALDESGLCSPGEQLDCIYEDLLFSSCVGVNGFLAQVNIASIVNIGQAPLQADVQYFDGSGELKGSVQTLIEANRKTDLIINDLGLEPDTVGTVCVNTDGAWAGGVAIYKPNQRFGTSSFGESFDYALYYPFVNPFQSSVSVPLNTYHLGTDPSATVANWIALSDAEKDGIELRGKLSYYDASGKEVSSEEVRVPDGGRVDFAGHVGLAGIANKDAIGSVRFFPATVGDENFIPPFYLTLTRYFYDCPGSSCSNFLTAFPLPHRPSTNGRVFSAIAAIEDEIAVLEINNSQSNQSNALVKTFGEDGFLRDNPVLSIPGRGSRHVILNRSPQSFGAGEIGHSSVETQVGYLSSLMLLYKLDSSGKLQYAYATPFVGSPGKTQVLEFNSFLNQGNTLDLVNQGLDPVSGTVIFVASSGAEVLRRDFTLPALVTRRLSNLSLPANLYGTVVLQADQNLSSRSYVQKSGEYILPFSPR